MAERRSGNYTRLAIAIVVAAVVVAATIGLSISSTTTTRTVPEVSTSTITTTVTSISIYSGSYSSSHSPGAPVQIVSVKLVNTTIGSHVVFDVAFENVGNSTIYYASPDGRTSPVSASINSSSAISPQSTATGIDCMRTISAVALAPGAVASAETTDCVDPNNYEIASAGVIQAVVTVRWSANASAVFSGITSVSEDFAVGSASTVMASAGGRLYEVIFKQTGDCTPTVYAEPWSVTLGPWTVAEPSNATLPISTTGGAYDPNLINESTIIFSVPDGQYPYSVDMGAWNIGNPTGVVNVDGADVMVLVQGPLVSCTVTTSA